MNEHITCDPRMPANYFVTRAELRADPVLMAEIELGYRVGYFANLAMRQDPIQFLNHMFGR